MAHFWLEPAPCECDGEAFQSGLLQGKLLVIGWDPGIAGKEGFVRLRGIGSLVQEVQGRSKR